MKTIRSKEDAVIASEKVKSNKYAELLKEAIEKIAELEGHSTCDFLKKQEVKDFWNDYHGAYYLKV